MPNKKVKVITVVPKFRVKYKDIFDLKAFYEALHEWLLEYDWKDAEDKSDHWETYYGERIDNTGAKEIWFQWRPIKDPVDAPFLRYYLDFDFHCIAITSAEIVKDGMKLKVNKGEVELFMTAYMELKYEKEFDQHWLLKEFKALFTKRVYRKILEQRKKELYQETYALQNYIKQFFKLKRYLPYEETKSFFPSQAWPSHIKEK